MKPRLKTQLASPPTQLTDPAAGRPILQRPLAVLVLAFAAHFWLRSPPAHGIPVAESALVTQLAERASLSASPSDVHWVDPPAPWWAPWRTSRAWVLAGTPGGQDDVYIVHTRRAPSGQLVALCDVFNLTDSRATGELQLTAYQHQAAWLSPAPAAATTLATPPEYLRLTWADLDATPQFGDTFTPLQKLQWNIAWWQQWGEWSGVHRQTYKLIPVANAAWLDLKQDSLELVTSNGKVALDPSAAHPEGQHLAKQPGGTAQPGNVVTWAVDRVRQAAWFGDNNMQRVKAVAYQGWDLAQRRLGIGTAVEDTEITVVHAEPPSDLASPVERNDGHPIEASTPAAIRRAWPPSRLTPVLTPAEPQEGQWLALNNDPFIKPTSDPAGLFYTTFLRTDPEREFSRIIITTWDPLTVELHVMSGTEEPKSATGETGPGMVPRENGVVEQLVAAFNGGFQATHGDFGMKVDGVVYVPPLPFGATVAVDAVGKVGFGTWPGSTADGAGVSDSLRSFRQNLTPLVAQGAFNPYQRTWWGGVPSGWEDDTRTVRSGICLTKSGLIAYFYGAKVDAENLAKAMLANDCDYGLHLDMNQGHTGLEFYHVASTEQLPPLALTLQGMWQAEGSVSETTGLAFRGRRMFRAMQLMNFPRYIQRETRDFFYLTARPLLPRSGTGADAWRVPPNLRSAFPPPVAVKQVSPVAHPTLRVNLLELDPAFVEPQTQPKPSDLVVATLPTPLTPSTLGGQSVWWLDGRFSVGIGAPDPSAVRLVAESKQGDGLSATLACVHPTAGTLLVAEVASGADNPDSAKKLAAVLYNEGCTQEPLVVTTPLGVALAGRDLNGHPVETELARTSLTYRHPKRTFALFPNTPVVPVGVWKPLQARPAEH